MAKWKLDLSIENILNCVLYAVIGILLIALRSGALGILFTVVGILFIVMGVIDIIKSKDWVKAIIEIVIGAVIITCGWLIAEWVLLIFGILLAVKGILDFVKNIKKGFAALLAPIVMIVIGVLLVVAKFAITDILCIVAGVIFILNAILLLFGQKLVK